MKAFDNTPTTFVQPSQGGGQGRGRGGGYKGKPENFRGKRGRGDNRGGYSDRGDHNNNQGNIQPAQNYGGGGNRGGYQESQPNYDRGGRGYRGNRGGYQGGSDRYRGGRGDRGGNRGGSHNEGGNWGHNNAGYGGNTQPGFQQPQSRSVTDLSSMYPVQSTDQSQDASMGMMASTMQVDSTQPSNMFGGNQAFRQPAQGNVFAGAPSSFTQTPFGGYQPFGGQQPFGGASPFQQPTSLLSNPEVQFKRSVVQQQAPIDQSSKTGTVFGGNSTQGSVQQINQAPPQQPHQQQPQQQMMQLAPSTNPQQIMQQAPPQQHNVPQNIPGGVIPGALNLYVVFEKDLVHLQKNDCDRTLLTTELGALQNSVFGDCGLFPLAVNYKYRPTDPAVLASNPLLQYIPTKESQTV